MKTIAKGLKTRRPYEAPRAEVIEIETQGVLCASTGAATGATGNGGTTNMNMQNGYGW